MKKLFEFLKTFLLKFLNGSKIEIIVTPELKIDKNFILNDEQFKTFLYEKKIILQRRKDQSTKDMMNKFVDFKNIYVKLFKRSLYGENRVARVSHMKEGSNRNFEFTLILIEQ